MYQVYVDTKLEERDVTISTFYEVVERFRNKLRLKKTNSKLQYLHTVFTTFQDKETTFITFINTEKTVNSVKSTKTVRSK